MAETYRVSGMTCDGCARAVANAIKARAPSAKVSVDLHAGHVKIDGPIDPQAVAAAIEGAGFRFVERV